MCCVPSLPPSMGMHSLRGAMIQRRRRRRRVWRAASVCRVAQFGALRFRSKTGFPTWKLRESKRTSVRALISYDSQCSLCTHTHQHERERAPALCHFLESPSDTHTHCNLLCCGHHPAGMIYAVDNFVRSIHVYIIILHGAQPGGSINFANNHRRRA